ncbi:DUF3857 domain-containing protein [Myroides odoratus]|uniref:Domain of Uncharacterized Function with PDB structure n=1 Tax=Myroides odoratus TaxID=256 RepID=A0A378U3R1_MYROD|nr:DUF3857 domain-containing protein [Myroides odoratus]QQU02848.1 DUF3857 domain-containing protein [Myroides odoratus]STZ69919.1 Domain of Uncharacterised Function with PDB structure [Myroides odoratus]
MNKVVLFAFGILSCTALAQQTSNQLLNEINIIQSPDAIFKTQADAVVLNEEGVVEYEFHEESGFKLKQTVKRSVLIQTKDGISHASLQIPFYFGRFAKEEVVIESYKIYRIVNGKEEVVVIDKAINTKVEEDFYLKEIKVNDIQVGDRIEYTYTKVIDNIDTIPVWYFQENIPKLKSSYTVKIPDNLTYLITTTGNLSLNEKKEVTQDARNLSSSRWGTSYRFKEAILQYSAVNIPAFQYEPFMDSSQNNVSSIRFDLIQFQYPMSSSVVIPHEPAAVAKEIYKGRNFGSELRLDSYWIKQLKDFPVVDGSELEKAAQMIAFVQSKIKWNQQYGYWAEKGVKKAMNQGVGNGADINLALIGALRAVGIYAEPIVLSTQSNGKAPLLFSRFMNHVIVGFKIENQLYMVDGILPNAELNVLPFEDLNGTGWMITEEFAVTKIDLTPKQLSFKQEEFSLQLDESGHVAGQLNSTLTSYEALAFQTRYGESPLNRSRGDIEARSPQLFLNDGKITPKQGEVELAFQVRKFNFATIEEEGKTMRFNPLALYRDKENPFVSATRQSDVYFMYPFMDMYKVTIQLPAGYKVKQLANSGILTNKTIGMNMTYEVKELDANQLQIAYTLRVTNTVVPKEYYNELRAFYLEMNSKMNQSIVLEKINEAVKK